MLRELAITNLALIERLHVLFQEGLTVFTGETGAGKSIILQALSLLAGGRAGGEVVRPGAAAAEIEARFEAGDQVTAILDGAGLAAEGEVVIRRSIPGAGRSRFYVNGRLATARLAGELMENLVSVASQHDQQLLRRPGAHLEFVDGAGGLEDHRRRYREHYDQWRRLHQRLASVREHQRRRRQEEDFLRYQCEEIDKAALVPGEEEELLAERRLLQAADRLRLLAGQAAGRLENGLAELLHPARKDVEEGAGLDPRLEPVAAVLAECCYRIEDVAGELTRYLDNLEVDPARLEAVGERLDTIARLKRKYGDDIPAILDHRRRIGEELAGLEDLEEEGARLAAQVEEAAAAVLAAARDLSRRRRRAAGELQTTMEAQLAHLGMAGARFQVAWAKDGEPSLEDLGPEGGDQVSFLFSANPGVPPQPLARIASGGELSRLTLALKVILAGRDQVPTVIFDEVDAGISGRAAEAVGGKIQELAGHHQVICVTHLAQIAARAAHHYLVAKESDGTTSRTTIRQLAAGERPAHLAAMLDGAAVSGRALDYAHELLRRTGATGGGR